MAATPTSHSQREKYRLRWNDEVLIDIPADVINNLTTFTNMFKYVDEEPVISCCSNNIKGTNVKLYFQHHQSFLANQVLPTGTFFKVPDPPTFAKSEAVIDPTKLMDLLLVANYFDDSAMLLTISRRIITTVHDALREAKKNKSKMKDLREKFGLLPPEIQNLILDDLEEYAAIKGYHLVRHVSLPSDQEYKIKDILITNQGQIIADLAYPELVIEYGPDEPNGSDGSSESYESDGSCASDESYTSDESYSDEDTDYPPELEIQHIKIYDELNPQLAEVLNKLGLAIGSYRMRSSIRWGYNGMGGLAADGVVRALMYAKSPVDPWYKAQHYFYLPDGSRIKSKDPIDKIIRHRRIAVTTPFGEQLVDILTGRLTRELGGVLTGVPTLISYRPPIGLYEINACGGCTSRDTSYSISELDSHRNLLRFTITRTDGRIDIKIDPYRQLVYVVVPKTFEKNDKIRTLMILDFKGQMVARYAIQGIFSIYFSSDILVTVECNQSIIPSLISLRKVDTLLKRLSHGGRSTQQLITTMTPLEMMPRATDTVSEYVIVERDLSNGWRPLKILSKIPTSINSAAPQVIFSPNGHYLLMAPPADGKLSDFTSPTVAYTRLHSAEEIVMIREALLGPSETGNNVKSSEIKASTSSTP